MRDICVANNDIASSRREIIRFRPPLVMESTIGESTEVTPIVIEQMTWNLKWHTVYRLER